MARGACTSRRPVEELQEIVARAPRVRVLGSRHSFTDIADSDELVSLAALPAGVTVNPEAGTVSFAAGMRYGELAAVLSGEGLALVTSSGDVVRAARGDPDFDGMVVGLGALGAVTRIALDAEPAYDVRQH